MKAEQTTVQTHHEGSLVRIPLPRIVKHPDVPYRPLDKDWAAKLSASIEADGLDQPLLIWNGGSEKGKKMKLGEGEDAKTLAASFLIAGLHRLAALKDLQKRNKARFDELFSDGIPCFVHAGELTDVLVRLLRENVARREMNPDEVYPILDHLMAKESKGGAGMRAKDVAEKLGKSQAWISQILAVREQLGEEGMQALRKKEVTLTDAREAAVSVKKAKAAGKEVDAAAELKKIKDKKAKVTNAGRERAPRKIALKTLFERYKLLPRMKASEQVAYLESIIGYSIGDENVELPEELTMKDDDGGDADDGAADEKPSKKAKKAAAEDTDSDE